MTHNWVTRFRGLLFLSVLLLRGGHRSNIRWISFSYSHRVTRANENALSTFHNNCACSILKLARRQQHNNYISTQTILNRLRLPRIEALYAKHQLRWAGHVSRMSYSRLPRKFLNSWMSTNRPTGAPNLTFPRYLNKILKRHNINPKRWHVLAANKDNWRNRIASLR